MQLGCSVWIPRSWLPLRALWTHLFDVHRGEVLLLVNCHDEFFHHWAVCSVSTKCTSNTSCTDHGCCENLMFWIYHNHCFTISKPLKYGCPLSPHISSFAKGSDGEVIRAAESLVWVRPWDSSPTCWPKHWEHGGSLHPYVDLWRCFRRLEFNVEDWHGLAARTCFYNACCAAGPKKTHQHVSNVDGRVILTYSECNDVIGMSSSTTLSPHKSLVHHFSPIDLCVFPFGFRSIQNDSTDTRYLEPFMASMLPCWA